LRELLQVGYGIRRGDQPAQAPAGHAEILGKTIKNEGRIVHLEDARRIHAVGQPVVDLVYHQVAVVRTGSLGQARQFVTVEHCAGRVGRRRDQGTYGVLVPVTVNQIGGQLVVHFRAHRYQLRTALDQAQEVAVARVTRVCQQPVLAWVDQQAAGQQQCTRAARGDQDTFRVDRHAIPLAIEAGDCLAQGRQAPCGGVTGMSGSQRGLAGLDDGCGGGEVRLADFQVDHVVAGRLQLVGPCQQRHDVKGFDGAAARTVGVGHDLLSIGSKLVILPSHGTERTPHGAVNT